MRSAWVYAEIIPKESVEPFLAKRAMESCLPLNSIALNGNTLVGEMLQPILGAISIGSLEFFRFPDRLPFLTDISRGIIFNLSGGEAAVNSRDAIKLSLDMGEFVAMTYLADLTDNDLMLRPHPKCNHLNWQIGHIISSEHKLLKDIVPGGMPSLPAGFAEKYTQETAALDDASKFSSKDELMSTYKVQRAATLKGLAAMSDSQLDANTGVEYAPSVGSMFALQGSHWLMHCGQWVIVRRNLGKPTVI